MVERLGQTGQNATVPDSESDSPAGIIIESKRERNENEKPAKTQKPAKVKSEDDDIIEHL
ncbi:hypothetical protein AC578_3824 [Pseudocercospora eumusae]|uniref:Uncharacterized protein n=1 Tax=Pseudocercospora eumusae TaxID=321146 RepID=A0A139HFK2_9PEZI|nr:hypothetical protein AC578_3824 [Pseudocercospora eumusae]